MKSKDSRVSLSPGRVRASNLKVKPSAAMFGRVRDISFHRSNKCWMLMFSRISQTEAPWAKRKPNF